MYHDIQFNIQTWTILKNGLNKNVKIVQQFFYWTKVYLWSDLWVPVSVTDLVIDLTCVCVNVFLVDEDTISILADNTDRALGSPKQFGNASAKKLSCEKKFSREKMLSCDKKLSCEKKLSPEKMIIA